MVKKAAWHKPADCIGFFPPTPGGELAKEIDKVHKEEGEKIGMSLRSIETGGVSPTKLLVRADMKAGEPCGRPDCVLDKASGGQEGLISYLLPCTGGPANFVRKQESNLNTGEKLQDQPTADSKNTRKKLRRGMMGMHFQNTWQVTIQKPREILPILTSK